MKLNLFLFLIVVFVENGTSQEQDIGFDPIGTLAKNCTLSPISYPGEVNRQTVNTWIQLAVDRFAGIDDVSETFTFIGGIAIYWTDECIAKVYESDEWLRKDIVMISNLEPDLLWKPDFLHRNSLTDSLRIGGPVSDRRLWLNVTNGEFQLWHFGRFTSYCNFNFISFPFDVQTCPVTIADWSYDSYILNLTTAKEVVDPDAMPFNSQWDITDISDSITNMQGFRQVKFNFEFKRRAQYFIANLFTPCLILSILELTSFMIPPDTPDRGVYTVTIMLTMFVLKTEIMSYLPQTPKPIYIAYYILADIGFATLCASYACFMCWMCYVNPLLVKRKNGKRMSTAGVIDNVAFLIACGLLFALNILTAMAIEI